MSHHGGMASNNHESGDERPRPRPGDIADLAMRLRDAANELELARGLEETHRASVMGLLEAAKRCAEPYVRTVGSHVVIADGAYDPEVQLTKFSSDRLPGYVGALVRAADRAQVNVSTVASRLTAMTGGGDVAADMERVLVALAGAFSLDDDAATDAKTLIDLVSRKHGGTLVPIHLYFEQVVSALRVDGVHRVLLGAEQDSPEASIESTASADGERQQPPRELSKLRDRQLDVLALLRDQETITREALAENLKVSTSTVDNEVSSIRKALGKDAIESSKAGLRIGVVGLKYINSVKPIC